MTDNLLDKWLNEAEENARQFAQEGLILDVTEAIFEALDERNLTKADLAEMLGRSKPYVSQLLSGGRNMTLRTLADVAFALGVAVKIQLREKGAFHKWQTVESVRQVKAPPRLRADVLLLAANGDWSDTVTLRKRCA